jgi:hypothetical protein
LLVAGSAVVLAVRPVVEPEVVVLEEPALAQVAEAAQVVVLAEVQVCGSILCAFALIESLTHHTIVGGTGGSLDGGGKVHILNSMMLKKLTSNLGGGAGGSTGGGAVGGTGGGTAAGGVGLQALVLLGRAVSNITLGSWWWHWGRSCRWNRRRLCEYAHEGDEMSTDVSNRLVVEPVEDQLVVQAVEVQVVVSSHVPFLLSRC